MTAASEVDLHLASGRLHGQRFGSADAPLVLCLPGLSANMTSFDYIGERLGGDELQLVALDLRGRGRSEVTAAGTYGWRNHALDVFAAGEALGAMRFSLIGQSMGGFVAMQAAAIDAGPIQRVVLVDVCGVPDPRTLPLIASAVSRLGQVYPSVDAYVGMVRRLGTVEPWSEYWERYLRYDLVEVEGGVRARSDLDAVLEDSRYAAEQDVYELWPSLTMPVLLLRAARELLPGAGRIVTDADRDRFRSEVGGAGVVEIDANHYGINTAQASVDAIREFFDAVKEPDAWQ